MNASQGFSLLEVMIAFVLLSVSSVMLLTAVWQTQQAANQALLRFEALLCLDNASERWLSGLPLPKLKPPFELLLTGEGSPAVMEIRWQGSKLQRTLEAR